MSKINQRQNSIIHLLKTPESSFRILFELAPVALVEGVWSTSFQVLRANPAALSLFGAASGAQFASSFNAVLTKIPRKVLLELLSARVKRDLFEAEMRLPTLRRGFVYVFMRLAYMPLQHAGPQHVILAFHDITGRKRRETLLKRLSQVDGLTQALNQRTILQRLDEELSRARRYQLDLSCIIFDLDNFKKVNDTFGHLWGDKCLKRAAQALRDGLRKTDIVGRYGGDEFLVILPETKADQATIPVQRFLNSYEACAVIKRQDKEIKTSFSIGISSFPAAGVESARDLIKAADEALYLSKTSGGNRYHLYSPSIAM
ncbi:MAG: sensor domain-containing diguanylate cyclase [Candidatus Omnitrophica bacterium]|nr:sensor domain-containing diguanylate cyclase [Candidatus Omnitrophota bacterium]